MPSRRRRRGPTSRRIATVERLERRDLLAVTIDRTSLNLRFSADVAEPETTVGEYQSFAITNTGPDSLADVWVRATGFSPTQRVQLGSGEDGLYFLGDLAAGAANAKTAFIYMIAESITSPPAFDPQSYIIEVWVGQPDAPGSTLVTAQGQLFRWVGEAIADDSSSRTDSVAVEYFFGGVPVSGPIVGGTMRMTVTGDIKNKPDRILFSPATMPDWPADAFFLADAVVTYSRDPQLPDDVIFEKPILSKPKDFSVVYTFEITAPTSAPTPVTPVQFTANGVEDLQSRKFDRSRILEGVADIPPAEFGTDLSITKTGAATAVSDGTTIYDYTITVTSTGAYASEDVVVTDVWPEAFTRLPIVPPPGTTVVDTPTGFTWTIGTLAGGLTQQLTVSFVVPEETPSGPFVNTATVSSSTPDPGPTTAQITTTVVAAAPTADLSIEKRDFVQEYTPGLPLQWQITVTNAGPRAVFGARVQDVFPPQIGAVSWTAAFTSGSGVASGVGSIDEFINLGVGGSAVYTVNAATLSTATGTLTNTATVTAPIGVVDPNTANNIWTDVDLIAPVADLAVSKIDDADTYVPGEATVYTVTVRNNGPSFVTGARVVDGLSTSFTNATWEATYTGVGSGGGTSGVGSIDQLVNLAAGGSVIYTITALVDPAATASIVNTATAFVPTGTTDPDLSNNSATDSNTAAPEVFLEIAKTDGTGSYVPGQTTTYVITVTNSGPSFLAGGRLIDIFPAEIVGATWTASYSGAGSGGDPSGGGDIDATVTLAPGGTATFTATAPVAPTAAGNLVNTATVLTPAGTTNLNPVNSATDTDTPAPLADLRVTKTDGLTEYTPGTTVTYSILVSNFGPSAVTGAQVRDIFPAAQIDVANVSWVAVFSNGSGAASGTGDIDESIDLGLYGTAVYTVTAPIFPTATGPLTNTATVSAPQGVTDPNLTNNTATDVDAPAGSPEVFADLAIEKRDFVQAYAPGETLTWQITVTNVGPNPVVGARVQDLFPATQVDVANVTWVATFSNGSGNGGGSGDINELIDLGAGGTAVYTVVAPTFSTATGTLTNTATVTPPDDVTDPNLTNNSWTDVDQMAPRADLAVTKTDAGTSYVPGETTTYTVIVTNNGPSFVTGARVSDAFATEFTNISWTAVFTGDGSTGTDSGTGRIDELVNLAAGGTATYTIQATVSPWATIDIANTATVTAPIGTLDPILSNNTATDTNSASPQVFLEISKDDATGTYTPGTTLTYTIEVTNAGPSALIGGTLVDDLPAAITGSTWTAKYLGTGSTGPASGSGDISATFTLAAGGRATFTVTAPVASTATGDLVNTASIEVPAGTTNTNPVTTATDIDTASPVADMRAAKTDGTAVYLPGTTTTYTLTISNFGPSAVVGARVIDTFDPVMFDVAAITWTAVLQDGSVITGSGDIDLLIDMDRGGAEEVVVFTVVAPILPSATGNLENTVAVSVPLGTTDYNLTNNVARDIDVEQVLVGNGLVTGTDSGCGSPPLVRVLDPVTGEVLVQFLAYEAGFAGGVAVATGDLDGDGIDEIITAPGRSRAGHVRVWTQDGLPFAGGTFDLFPFGESFVYGVELTVADINGDGFDDIVAGTSSGAGLVNVFLTDPYAADPVPNTPYRSFQPFPGPYLGGVNLAAADLGTFVDGVKVSTAPDGKAEVIVGSNAGMPATVKLYEVSTAANLIGTLAPIGPTFAGGVTLSVGRYDGDVIPDILVGAGIGGRSVVEVYSGSSLAQQARLTAFSTFGKPNAKVYATSLDLDGDGVIDAVYAVQGQQGAGGTSGVTAWDRVSGTTEILPLSVGLLPALRITNMEQRIV